MSLFTRKPSSKGRDRRNCVHRLAAETLESRELMAGDLQLDSLVVSPASPEIVPTWISGDVILDRGDATPTRAANDQSAGDLDGSFGSGLGFVEQDFDSTEDNIRSIAVQSDGKIIAGGRTGFGGGGWNFALARFNSNGTLDTSFGGVGAPAGLVATDVLSQHDEGIHSLLIQPDGKILAAGTITQGEDSLAAFVRYHEDGTLDEEFGDQGKVILELGGYLDKWPKVFYEADKIVVWFGEHLLRLNLDGSLDQGFGSAGLVNTVNQLDMHSLGVELHEGKIYLGGMHAGERAFMRLNLDGSVDGTFGTGGAIHLPEEHPFPREFFVDSDGKLVCLDSIGDRIFRYLPDGTLDNGPGAFSVDGIYEFGAAGIYGQMMVPQPGGLIAIVGQDRTADRLAVMRLAADGTPDTSFGNDGLVYHDFSAKMYPSSTVGFANGNLLIGGYIQYSLYIPKDFIVARIVGYNAPNIESPVDQLQWPAGPEPTGPQTIEHDGASELAGTSESRTVLAAGSAASTQRELQRTRTAEPQDDHDQRLHLDALYRELGSLSHSLATVLAPRGQR